LILALRYLRGPARVPSAICAIGVAGFMVLAAAGLPVLDRFLLVPDATLALFAAVGLLGWRRIGPGPRRNMWLAWAGIAATAVAIAIPGVATSIRDDHRGLAAQRQVVADLVHMLRTPDVEAAVGRCDAITTPEYRPVPLIAYLLRRSPSAITAAGVPSSRGTAFVSYTSSSVAMRLSEIPRRVKVLPVPFGFRIARHNSSWIVATAC
jgi:signal transduction histidine kinase